MLPYNDVAALEAAFAERGDAIAAVITEAAAGNMGVVPPAPGFTEALRRVTTRARRPAGLRRGDDRLPLQSPSGLYGLEGPYDEGAADLFTFGKVMGGGFPTAAFGGRADVMALLAPPGPVYQAGTLSGNPVATAAGLATLRGCTPEVYDRLDVVSKAIAGGGRRALAAAGVPHDIQWAGTMFSVFFRDGAVRDYDDAESQDTAGVHGVLPLDAEPGRAPAAERVRVVVRLAPATTTPPSTGSRALPAAARAVTDSFATLGS